MQIKFLTINIWFGGKVWDNLVEFIEKEKPDILALQEVYDSNNSDLPQRFRTMQEFRKFFGEFLPYDAFGPTVIDTGHDKAPWGNAVFSKFPIKATKTILFNLPLTHYNFKIDTDPRLAAEGMQEAELLIDDKSVYVYSWHGVWNHHGEDTPEREIMERVIVDSLKNKKSVILAGDTNMNPETNVIQNIQKQLELTSVFGESLQSTFNMSQKEHPGNYANSPVDMVFVTKDIRILQKEMQTVNISDHYPLSVEMEL